MDNRPENIDIVSNFGEHKFFHRKKKSGLRFPGEVNPMIYCKCGCNDNFFKYDKYGRPREYKPYHCPKKNPTQPVILNAFVGRELSPSDLMKITKKSSCAVRGSLQRLKKKGLVKQTKYGFWRKV